MDENKLNELLKLTAREDVNGVINAYIERLKSQINEMERYKKGFNQSKSDSEKADNILWSMHHATVNVPTIRSDILAKAYARFSK